MGTFFNPVVQPAGTAVQPEQEYEPQNRIAERLMCSTETEAGNVSSFAGKISQNPETRLSGYKRAELTGQEDTCNPLENDPQSMSIIIANHFFKTELGQEIKVEKADCDNFSPGSTLISDLTLSDGKKVRVIYNPLRNLARVQVTTASGKSPYCRYSYTCPADSSIHLIKRECG